MKSLSNDRMRETAWFAFSQRASRFSFTERAYFYFAGLADGFD